VGTGRLVLLLCAGLVVVLAGVAIVGVFTYTPTGTKVDYASLQAGDCFNRLALTPESVQLRRVSCGQPHHHEVFALVQSPAEAGAPFPGRDSMEQVAQATCAQPLENYLAGVPLPAGYRFGFVYPQQKRWDEGERTIVCEVFSADGRARTHSIRSA
jgi:hypothetical protein